MLSNLPSLATLAAPPKRSTTDSPRVTMTLEQLKESLLCSPLYGIEGFLRWCSFFVKIQDKATGREIPFDLFEGQARIAPHLVEGQWIMALKGRQLGLTWLMVAYCVWRIIYEHRYTVITVSQLRLYAEEFIWRIKWIMTRLPEWMCPQTTTDNLDKLRFESQGKEVAVFSLAGSAKAGRSFTADLLIADEGSRVDSLGETLAAISPALEVAGGQSVVLTTSAGPQGDFYDLWQLTYGKTLDGTRFQGSLVDEDGVGPSGFMPIFLHWSERPGRDQVWYEARAAELNAISPIAVKQEYPETPEEAFEYATGRIYPLFTRERCVGRIEVPWDTVRFRAIDWGGGPSAHAILWCAYFLGKPGLIVSPDCPETIREMLGYRWDPDKVDKPVKRDDHCADALRYLVTTARGGLTGLVYVYRELYIRDALSSGVTPLKLIEKVHAMSGWVVAPPELRDRWVPSTRGEKFETSIADHHDPNLIGLFTEFGIPTEPHRKFRGAPKTDEQTAGDDQEVLSGINHLSNLIDGSCDLAKNIVLDRTGVAIAAYQGDRRLRRRGARFSVPLSRAMQYREARDALMRKAR